MAIRGFWVIEQKAGNVTWQDVNSLVRPGVLRMFTYQLISRGANGDPVFPLAPAALRHREISRRGAAAQRSQHQTPHLQGSGPTGRGTEAAGPGHQRTHAWWRRPAFFTATTTTGRCSSRSSPTSYFNLREHIQLILQRAARPQYLGGFRAAHRGPLAIQAGVCALAAPAVRRRGGPAKTLRPERRHAGGHVQHRPGGRAQHGAATPVIPTT